MEGKAHGAWLRWMTPPQHSVHAASDPTALWVHPSSSHMSEAMLDPPEKGECEGECEAQAWGEHMAEAMLGPPHVVSSVAAVHRRDGGNRRAASKLAKLGEALRGQRQAGTNSRPR